MVYSLVHASHGANSSRWNDLSRAESWKCTRSVFYKDADFLAFEKAMAETMEQVPMRILAYCLMPNHWHLVLWPICRKAKSSVKW